MYSWARAGGGEPFIAIGAPAPSTDMPLAAGESHRLTCLRHAGEDCRDWRVCEPASAARVSERGGASEGERGGAAGLWRRSREKHRVGARPGRGAGKGLLLAHTFAAAAAAEASPAPAVSQPASAHTATLQSRIGQLPRRAEPLSSFSRTGAHTRYTHTAPPPPPHGDLSQDSGRAQLGPAADSGAMDACRASSRS